MKTATDVESDASPNCSQQSIFSAPQMSACTDTRVEVCAKLKAQPGKITECAVCNDRSTGKHYGVLTCEGCKSFFKRTVRNSTGYKCRNQNGCSITRTTRSRCPSCRFQKCLVAGMKKEGELENVCCFGVQFSSLIVG